MKRILAAAAAAALALLAGQPARAIPVNPILNPGFELYADIIPAGQPGDRQYFDEAIWWAEGFGSNATFPETAPGDRAAVVPADPSASNHNFWQSTLPPLQAPTLDFDAFEFDVEGGTISPEANNQIGFSLTPLYAQHPWIGIYWEGAVLFRADDMVPDAQGRVSMNPVAHGEIICPDWDPCRQFKGAYDAASTAGKHALLQQARVVQVSFWNFNRQASGFVAIDDVAIVDSDL